MEHLPNGYTLEIPQGITEICDYPMDDGKKLETLVVPDSVTKIGGGFLSRCSNIRTVIYPAAITRWDSWSLDYHAQPVQMCLPGVEMRGVQGNWHPAMAVGYCCHPEKYSREMAETYQTYLAENSSRLLPLLFAGDLPEGLTVLANMGLISPVEFEENYLQPALEANAVGCVAFLLDWKNKHKESKTWNI